ncbi:GntR family transcriptional regulator [Mycetocola zhadangensis]|uniref:GntR family transcriptional regulator n=1 Tax=Mycetocola zhadangensis TaxID=1164595 RepID=UPI003A4E4C67
MYERIRSQILDGTLEEGFPVRERDLAGSLEVSVTPVHEALVRLEAQGLVALHPRRGAVITPITVAEADAVLETRNLVEGYAGERIAVLDEARLGDFELRLQQNLDEQRATLQPLDPARFLKLDADFHGLIVGETQNPILSNLVWTSGDRLHRVRVRALSRNASLQEKWFEDHCRMHERLVDRDIDGYREQLRLHLDITGRWASV